MTSIIFEKRPLFSPLLSKIRYHSAISIGAQDTPQYFRFVGALLLKRHLRAIVTRLFYNWQQRGKKRPFAGHSGESSLHFSPTLKPTKQGRCGTLPLSKA